MLKHGGPPADGGHPGGRRTGGRYTTDGHTSLRYGGREDTEDEESPNVEAEKMLQQGERNDGRGEGVPWQLGNAKFQVRWHVCVCVCGGVCCTRARVKLKKSEGRR